MLDVAQAAWANSAAPSRKMRPLSAPSWRSVACSSPLRRGWLVEKHRRLQGGNTFLVEDGDKLWG